MTTELQHAQKIMFHCKSLLIEAYKHIPDIGSISGTQKEQNQKELVYRLFGAISELEKVEDLEL